MVAILYSGNLRLKYCEILKISSYPIFDSDMTG